VGDRIPTSLDGIKPYRSSLKGGLNTHYVRFPAFYSYLSLFCWIIKIVKNWSCRGRQRGKSGLYVYVRGITVVKCGKTILLNGGINVVRGLSPI